MKFLAGYLSVASFVTVMLLCPSTFAQRLDSAAHRAEQIKQYVDSVDNSMHYQQGKVAITNIAELNVTTGYKFIPAEKAQMILTEFWGNPKDSSVLGMIVRSEYTVTDTASWAFVITYDEAGYVKDDDADKINYDDLAKEIQKDEPEINKNRVAAGYPEIHFLGWAEKPYYDKEKKVLHWAKNIQFSNNTAQTLNYDVRVLGRKGILSLKAVGTMNQLADINKNIPVILSMASFTEENKYSKFNPSIDKIAAYTIGGLIAGKLIAKTGLLILVLKNIKLILIGLLGGFSAFRKKIAGWFSRKKKDTDTKDVPVAPLNELPAAEPIAAIDAPAADDAKAEIKEQE